MAWPHLPKAPITEAVMEVKVALPAGTQTKTISDIQNKIREDYPSRKKRMAWEGQFTVSLGDTSASSASQQHKCIGYLFSSKDGLRVMQARLDGFAFSWLKPYPTWEEFSSEARRLWEIYKQAMKPVQGTRLGLRYLNRIEIPHKDVTLGDWVHTGLRIPPELPQTLAGFFVRMGMPFENPRAVAMITQTVEVTSSPPIPLIFDIDVFNEEPRSVDTDDLWRQIDGFREIKNEVFFKSVTEKCLELFR